MSDKPQGRADRLHESGDNEQRELEQQSEDQLRATARELGIEREEEMRRDELLDAIRGRRGRES